MTERRGGGENCEEPRQGILCTCTKTVSGQMAWVRVLDEEASVVDITKKQLCERVRRIERMTE